MPGSHIVLSLILIVVLLGPGVSTAFAQFKGPIITRNDSTTSETPIKNGTIGFVGFSNTSGFKEVIVQPEGRFTINWSKSVPPIPAQEQAEREEMLEENAKYFAPILKSDKKIEPLKPGTETTDDETVNNSKQLIQKTAYQFVTTRDFRIFRENSNIYGSTTLGEPSVANKGRLIMVTGNNYAARSIDGGDTWEYAVASSLLPSSLAGVFTFDLCCDQDIIYDNNHGIFIWYMQGRSGSFKLSVSHDATTWTSWTVRALGFAGWSVPRFANLWWDYPQIALSDNNLFIASNVMVGNPQGNAPPPQCGGPTFGCGGNAYSRSAVLRINLGQLSSGLMPIPISVFWDRIGFGLAQGARDTMYIGAHISNGQIRVYKWPDNGQFRQFDFNIPAWDVGGRFSCRTSDGADPCAFHGGAISGGQINNGWVRPIGQASEVGFLWNVGAGRPCSACNVYFPYVESAVFLSGVGGLWGEMSFLAKFPLWNPNYAWINAFASSNNRGVGLVAWKVGGTVGFPSLWAAIHDSPNSLTWDTHLIAQGTSSGGNRLGDYLRVRPYTPEQGIGSLNSPLWIGIGYVHHNQIIDVHQFVFGREVDEPSWRLER